MKLVDLFVNISAAGLGATHAGITRMHGVLERASGGMDKLAHAAKWALAGIGAGVTLALHEIQKFEKEMSYVSTMLGESDMFRMDAIGEQMHAMSREFGQSTQTLSNGLYTILSAGIAPAQSMEVLRAAASGAAGGFTETALTVDAMTTILNSFRMDASQAGDVMDKMFGAVKRGKQNMAELAGSIGKAAATASLAGVSLEEFLALEGTLTRFGIKPDIAMTSVVGILQSFMGPAEQSIPIARRFGVELSTTTLKTEGLIKTLLKLKTATPEEIRAIFPNIRGFRGVAAALGDVTGLQADYALQMDSAGLSAESLSKRADTLDFTILRLKETFFDLFVELGKDLMPAFKQFAEWLGALAAGWDTHGKHILEQVIYYGKLVAVLSMAVIGLKAVFGVLAAVTANPMALLLTGVALVGLHFSGWLDKLSDVKGAIQEIADKVGGIKFKNEKELTAGEKSRTDSARKLDKLIELRERQAKGGMDPLEAATAAEEAANLIADLKATGLDTSAMTPENAGSLRKFYRDQLAGQKKTDLKAMRDREITVAMGLGAAVLAAEQKAAGFDAMREGLGIKPDLSNEVDALMMAEALSKADATVGPKIDEYKRSRGAKNNAEALRARMFEHQAEAGRLTMVMRAVDKAPGVGKKPKTEEDIAEERRQAITKYWDANKAMIQDNAKMEMSLDLDGHALKLALLDDEKNEELNMMQETGRAESEIRRKYDLKEALLQKEKARKDQANDIAAKQSILGKVGEQFLSKEEIARADAEAWKDEMLLKLGPEGYAKNEGIVNKIAQGMVEGQAKGGQWMGFADVYKSIQTAAMQDPMVKLTEQELEEIKGLRADVREGLKAQFQMGN